MNRLSPLFLLENPTGPFAMECTERVVFLWVLLLSPARMTFAMPMVWLKARVIPMVRRFAVVLVIRSALCGVRKERRRCSLLTRVLLILRWFVALKTTMALPRAWVYLRVLCVMVIMLSSLGVGPQMGIFTRLVSAVSRLMVVGCIRL